MNIFKYKFITNLFGLLFLVNYMLINNSYTINMSREIFIKIVIYGILVSQGFILIYFFKIKSKIKYKILLSLLWNFGLATLGYNLWLYDKECNNWALENKFNGHMIWHITICWSLFNTINITNVCKYTFNNIDFIWKPLIKKCPWFLYLIIINKNEYNNKINDINEIDKLYEITNIKIDPSYDNIKINDINNEFNLLINKKTNSKHRRVKTYS